ncbi:MAG TPA: hypothetical protein VG323_05360 [Thermoanaerobaculia bacterium]|nr:hypothetical protein [Thermoanaerobaculia bacterium]
MNAYDDDFNPKFVYFASAPADLSTRVDEAIRACSGGASPVGRGLVLEELGTPAPGTMRIDLWLERADRAGRTFGFLCSSANGTAPYARGERTVA